MIVSPPIDQVAFLRSIGVKEGFCGAHPASPAANPRQPGEKALQREERRTQIPLGVSTGTPQQIPLTQHCQSPHSKVPTSSSVPHTSTTQSSARGWVVAAIVVAVVIILLSH